MVRDDHWDCWRGIAMLAVIAIHSTPFDGIDLAGNEAVFLLVMRQVANFSVALLLAISGMMAGWSRQPCDGRWVLVRLKRLLPPYILWSLLFMSIHNPDHFRSLPYLVVDFVSGQGMLGIGYFVVLLLQMIVLTPLIARIGSVRSHLLWIVAITAAGLAYSYVVGPANYYLLSKFPYTALPFPVFYPFYHLGFLVAREGMVARLSGGRTLAAAGLAAVVALGLSIAEALAWLPIKLSMANAQVKASSLFYSLTIFALMLGSHRRVRFPVAGWLAWFGRNSYAIYVIHLFPVLALLDLMRQGPFPPGGPAATAVVILGGVAAVSVAILVLRKILPQRVQPILLG